MSVIKRHDEILRLVRETGSIEVDGLARAIRVSRRPSGRILEILTHRVPEADAWRCRKRCGDNTGLRRAASKKQRGEATHRPGGGGIDSGPLRGDAQHRHHNRTGGPGASPSQRVDGGLQQHQHHHATVRHNGQGSCSVGGRVRQAMGLLSARMRSNSFRDTRWITPSSAVRPWMRTARSLILTRRKCRSRGPFFAMHERQSLLPTNRSFGSLRRSGSPTSPRSTTWSPMPRTGQLL